MAAGMSIVVVIFFVFVVRFALGHARYGPGFFTHPFYDPATFSFKSVFHGTSVAVLTYIGFDAISTFSEEVENPRRNIMLATVLVCLITGVLASLEVYAAQLVWQDRRRSPLIKLLLHSRSSPKLPGGYFLFQLVNFTILIANIGSGMGSQLGAARLLYGMGRSDGIPKKFFGAVDPKSRVPRNNVIFVGVIALVGSFIITYDQGADLLNFGALLAFMGVNIAALVRYYIRAEKRNIINLLSPLFGFLICAFIWTHLSGPALKLGAIWMVIGITYGAIRTRGFKAELVNFDVPSEES